MSGAFVFVGTTALFESAGFRKVQKTAATSGGCARWVVRLELGDET